MRQALAVPRNGADFTGTERNGTKRNLGIPAESRYIN